MIVTRGQPGMSALLYPKNEAKLGKIKGNEMFDRGDSEMTPDVLSRSLTGWQPLDGCGRAGSSRKAQDCRYLKTARKESPAILLAWLGQRRLTGLTSGEGRKRVRSGQDRMR